MELEVRDGSGVVFSELVAAHVPEAFDGIQRDVVLEPGAYTATAQVYGYGTAKSFSLSGSFTAR